ncbi:MAG TPA: YaiO family outer membrane beta-barrel protein [Candidatus Acidoferrales bacterium]|nr:YaiO family outer membrane beta-barrel protein [Candidatus Acidoferrales bacterium]
MTIRRLLQKAVALLTLTSALALQAHAQQEPTPADPPATSPQQPAENTPAAPVPEKILTDFVEVGASYRQLSNNFGDWSGGYARGVLTTGNNIWNAEINGQHEFGDAGVYMAAGDTYNFNSDWYGALTLGSSVGGFFWPRFRADAFVNRKWSARKQFITTLGYGYYASKDVHRDQSVFLGTTYYFQKPWIIEDGIRFNVSNPGVVFSPAGFVAVTEGSNKHHYVTVNAGFGEEAYQLVGPSAVLARFESQNMTITWRQWTGKNWGFNLVADYYHSPFYQRGGGSFGLFKEF